MNCEIIKQWSEVYLKKKYIYNEKCIMFPLWEINIVSNFHRYTARPISIDKILFGICFIVYLNDHKQ